MSIRHVVLTHRSEAYSDGLSVAAVAICEQRQSINVSQSQVDLSAWVGASSDRVRPMAIRQSFGEGLRNEV